MHQLGKLIEDKYEVLAKLREGGMGAIYKVRHRLLDEVRIVKVMRQGAEGDTELRRRFLEEAKTATRLKHPNICTIYDFAMDDDGTAYLVMEFIDGVTLSDLLKTRGSPGLGLSLRIGGQALRALSYLHRKNVVHRDIAPDNLMLTADDEGAALIKLIDLGIAKVLDRKVEMTSSGVFLGKVRYASPEQFGTLPAGETIDGRSDLYSLGLVLYELVTGRRAFVGETPVELMRAQVFQEPVAFSESDPTGSVPEAVRALILKSLRKNRENRFQSAGEFAREIEALLPSVAPADPDSGEQLIHTVRLSRLPSADPVTPGVQEMLNRPFLGQVTPEPSSGLEVVSGTVHRTSFLKEIADREAHGDISGLESLLTRHLGEADLANAVQSAIAGLRRKQDSEKADEASDWTKALNQYSEEGWNRYLVRHPRSERAEEARGRLGEVRAFREALGHDSLPAWESFLSQWPKGHFRQRADSRLAELRDEIARDEEAAGWTRAEGEASEEGWRRFLESHPRSPRLEQARRRWEEARDFAKAAQTDTLPSWESFRSRWGNGALRARAEARVRELQERAAFDSAESAGKAAGWRDFLARFPASSVAAVARAHLDERNAFESAAAADSEAAWFQYLRDFGREAGAKEARDRLARAQRRDQEEYDRVVAQGTSEPLRRYLADRPSSKNRAAAEALLAETAAFEEAGGQGVEALDRFLESFPRSRFRDRARERRADLQRESERRAREKNRAQEEADWASAVESPSEEAWERFLQNWPKSAKRGEAGTRLAEQRERSFYARVLETDGWQICREFLERFPKSPRADEVRALLEERRAFEAAAQSNDRRGWTEFQDQFPQSRLGPVVRQRLDELRAQEERALSAAVAAKNAGALERFLESFPQAHNRQRAEGFLAETRSFEGARAGGREALQKYLLDYPNGLYEAPARQIAEDLRQQSLLERIAQAEKAGRTEDLQRLASEAASGRAAEVAARALADLRDRQRKAQEEADWRAAEDRNDSGAWKAFLESHPKSHRAPEARRLLAAAEKRDAQQQRLRRDEEKAWQRAVKTNSRKGWERFLAAYPSSAHAAVGRQALDQLRAETERKRTEAVPEQATVVLPRPERTGEREAAVPGRPSRSRALIGVAAAVVVVLVAAVVYLHFRAAVPTAGSLAIDAVPWARIVSIENASGKNVLDGRDEYTPASFQLPPGRYRIRLSNPGAPGKELTLSAEIAEGQRSVSTGRFEPIDAASYLEAEGWAR